MLPLVRHTTRHQKQTAAAFCSVAQGSSLCVNAELCSNQMPHVLSAVHLSSSMSLVTVAIHSSISPGLKTFIKSKARHGPLQSNMASTLYVNTVVQRYTLNLPGKNVSISHCQLQLHAGNAQVPFVQCCLKATI